MGKLVDVAAVEAPPGFVAIGFDWPERGAKGEWAVDATQIEVTHLGVIFEIPLAVADDLHAELGAWIRKEKSRRRTARQKK